ncbi:MAG: ECF transporter S component [Lachnospiraceae bacterium]|jgi:energy-coupling factor transport system substrate-specific component|nr:ECF transporter S component [Lachnospiraceae bacterium]
MIVIKNQKLKRILGIIIPLVLIPAVAVCGSVLFSEQKHIFVSLVVAFFSLVLFITGFERKVTGTRRMVLVAVMTAISVLGRFIPFFKPITALTVITAMYLGGEAGFLVGSLSALLSNFYFGQGPWTAFQMLAWGLIGYVAGLIAESLKRNRALLLAYGVLSGIAFSLIMDVWTVLWYSAGFDMELYIASITAAIPHTILYAVSNFIFLFFLAKPFGDKLERIKVKYGV